jgi:hypothetical protein
MTKEKRSDLPSTDGAPAPTSDQAAANESATPRFTPITLPTNPPTTKPEPDLGDEYTWDEAEDGLVITADDAKGAVGHDEKRILKRSNARLPSAWIKGPGGVEILTEGLKLLRGAAKAAGTPVTEVKAVIVQALPKLEMVLVAPTKEGAPGSIPTRRTGHGPLQFTISEILLAAGMEITSGYRELFPVKKVSDSPIGPAIGIVLRKPLMTRKVGKKKAEA